MNYLRGAARYFITVVMGAIVAASVIVCLLVIAMQQRGMGYCAGKPATTALSFIVLGWMKKIIVEKICEYPDQFLLKNLDWQRMPSTLFLAAIIISALSYGIYMKSSNLIMH
jgi:hypothetical protein